MTDFEFDEVVSILLGVKPKVRLYKKTYIRARNCG